MRIDDISLIHLDMDSLLELEDCWAWEQSLVAAVEDLQLHRDLAIVGDIPDATRSVVHHSLQLRPRVLALQSPLSLIADHWSGGGVVLLVGMRD